MTGPRSKTSGSELLTKQQLVSYRTGCRSRTLIDAAVAVGKGKACKTRFQKERKFVEVGRESVRSGMVRDICRLVSDRRTISDKGRQCCSFFPQALIEVRYLDAESGRPRLQALRRGG